MTEQQALKLRKKLEEHYGQPVCPVSEYCTAFKEWGAAAEDYLKSNYAIDIDSLQLAIRKSNLLYRLIYRKQKVRMIKCPVHKGKWSGCCFPDEDGKAACGCEDSGGNLTGWIAQENDRNAPHFDSDRNYLPDMDDLSGHGFYKKKKDNSGHGFKKKKGRKNEKPV